LSFSDVFSKSLSKHFHVLVSIFYISLTQILQDTFFIIKEIMTFVYRKIKNFDKKFSDSFRFFLAFYLIIL